VTGYYSPAIIRDDRTDDPESLDRISDLPNLLFRMSSRIALRGPQPTRRQHFRGPRELNDRRLSNRWSIGSLHHYGPR
jgi:hypothetical protein